MKKLLLLLTAFGFSALCFAYPITPRPLRKLVIESENIVWAYVAEIGTVKQKNKHDHDWDRDFAKLIVKELLQGTLTSDTITVFFSSGMICPAPGVFYEGEVVLAFLDKRDKKDGYEVPALSYGVKHDLRATDYDIFKSRIREMQEFIHAGIAKENNEKIISWLVKCAEQKCTRWDGVYELSPQSDFMSYYDRDDQLRKDLYLNSPQKNTLFAALLSVDTLDYDDVPLTDIVRGVNDSLLLDFLKLRLARVDNEFHWPARDIMQRIVHLTGNIELESLSEAFREVYFDSSDDGKQKRKQLLTEFINRMKDVNLKKIALASGNWNA
jgi:hypothetical protein